MDFIKSKERYEKKIASRISKKNDPFYVHTVLTLRYFLIFVLALIAGAHFFTLFDFNGNAELISLVSLHFSSVISECNDMSQFIASVLRISENYLRHIIVLFASGFTAFCSAATIFIPFFKGFSLGYSVLWLHKAMSDGLVHVSYAGFSFAAFMISHALCCSIIIWMARSATIFRFNYLILRNDCKSLIRSEPLRNFVLSALSSAGTILLINMVYSLCIHITS